MPYSKEDLYDDTVQIQHKEFSLFGSGRLIGQNLLLTARHILYKEGSAAPVEDGWQVRLNSGRYEAAAVGKSAWVDATVKWSGPELDLAILKLLPEPGARDWDPRLKLRIARIDEVRHHRVRALGFPRGAKAEGKRTLFVPSGDLDDEKEATLSFGIDQAYQPELPEEDWRGFSGSAVLLADCEDSDTAWIYGVVQHVPPSFTRRLAVARLAEALKDEHFRTLLQQSGVQIQPAADPTIPLWKRLSWNDLHERTQPQIDLERESLRTRICISPNLDTESEHIQSALVGQFDNFMVAQTWKQSCLTQISQLLERLESFSEFGEATEVAASLRGLEEKLKRREPYSMLRRYFTDALIKRWVLTLAALRKRVLARGVNRYERSDLEQSMSALQRRALELASVGRESVFGKCFLVMGGVGSGKTHFLTDLLAARSEDGLEAWRSLWLPIWVQHPMRATEFAKHLLQTVQRETRVDWPSIEEFLTFVSSHRSEAKVVVIIDHLHGWIDWDSTIVKELASAIQDYTRFDQLHWLICLNDRAYANIAPMTQELWALYCDAEPNQFFRPPSQGTSLARKISMPRSGGWYRLDVINEQQELGLRLLRSAVQTYQPTGENEEVDLRDQHWTLDRIKEVAQEIRRELSNPLIATVLIVFANASSVELASLVDARFIDFIARLRKLLIDRCLLEWHAIATHDSELALEQAIDYVARVFATSDRAEQPLVQVQQRVMDIAKGFSPLGEPELLAKAIRSLDRAHVLEIVEREAPDGIARIEWVLLRLELFWEFHLAQQRRVMLLRQPDPNDAVEELLRWLGTFQGKRLMSGVAQFLLVLLDSDGGKIADELWSRSLAGSGFQLHSALFAAPQTPLARQRQVSGDLLEGHVIPRAPDDLVALVSFVHLSAEEATTVPQKVAILHRHFEALGRAGLGSYCAFALSYLIARADKMAVMQKVLRWLDGAELLGVAEADALARLCVERITQILGEHDSGGLVDAILAYARHSRKLSIEYERERFENVVSSQLKGRDRYLFRHWLFDHACFHVAREKRADTYWFLWKRKWYGAARLGRGKAVDSQVAIEMEKFANFAICDSSQHEPDLRRKLMWLVHDLVESNELRHRENAYYLIRHSEPIPLPGVPVVVDGEFRSDLQKIANDRRLEHLLSRPDTLAFLTANLGNDFGPGWKMKKRTKGVSSPRVPRQ